MNVEMPGAKPPRLMGGTGDCTPSDAPRQPNRGANIGAGPDHWYETVRTPGRARSSLVVQPADGRLPPLTQWADERTDNICRHVFDSYVYLDPWVRCISRGVPGSMLPSAYNNAYQIVQIPGYVVIVSEMIHDARMIPLDGRPPVGPDIRLWMGSPRGRWDGNTLVVDTTNFHDRGAIRGYPHSDKLHVVERFTFVDAKTLGYEATIDDPKTWSAPWKVAFSMNREDDYKMFEYACHEGNLAVDNILSGARLSEKDR
jgi:hypothetical protein